MNTSGITSPGVRSYDPIISELPSQNNRLDFTPCTVCGDAPHSGRRCSPPLKITFSNPLRDRETSVSDAILTLALKGIEVRFSRADTGDLKIVYAEHFGREYRYEIVHTINRHFVNDGYLKYLLYQASINWDEMKKLSVGKEPK